MNEDHKTLKDFLSYEAETGKIFWVKSPNEKIKVGQVAGTTDKKGYIRVKVFKKSYLAHRLAWFLHYGEWPSRMLDHKDQNPSNNKISNLRECSRSENGRNRQSKKNSSSGYLGVCWGKYQNKWLAQARFNGKLVYLGSFTEEVDAAKAYDNFAKQFFGVFANLNFKEVA